VSESFGRNVLKISFYGQWICIAVGLCLRLAQDLQQDLGF